MYIVTITDNIKGKNSLTATCTKKEYTSLTSIENWGGFKRFSIELYDDKAKGKSNIEEIVNFLMEFAFPNVKKEALINLFNPK